MKVDVKETGACTKHLTFEIPTDEISQTREEYFREVIKDLHLPGFRRGRVPRSLAEKKFGTKIQEEIKNELINKSISDAYEKHNIRALGNPDIQNTKFTPDAPMTFELDTEVEPEFELPDFRKFEITKPRPDVTDDEVTRTVESIRQRLAQYKPVEDRTAQDDDFIEGEAVLIKDGADANKFPVYTQVSLDKLNNSYTIIKGKDKLKGANKGDTIELRIELPDNHQFADIEGTEVDCTLSVNSIVSVELPDLDDEFAARIGLKTIDEFKENIQKRLLSEKESATESKVEDDIITKLVESVVCELPEKALENTRINLKSDFQQRLQYLPPDMQSKQMEEYEKNLEENARNTLKSYIIINRIAEAEKIDVNRDDLESFINRASRSSGRTHEQILQDIAENQRMQSVYSGIVDRKVIDFLKKNVTITEEDNSAEDKAKEEKANNE